MLKSLSNEFGIKSKYHLILLSSFVTSNLISLQDFIRSCLSSLYFMKLPAGKEAPYVRRYFKLETKTFFVLVKPKTLFILGTWYKNRHVMPCMRKVVLEKKYFLNKN